MHAKQEPRDGTVRPEWASVDAVCARFGIGRSRLYLLIKEGRIEARKLGRRTLISCASVDALLRALPEAGAA